MTLSVQSCGVIIPARMAILACQTIGQKCILLCTTNKNQYTLKLSHGLSDFINVILCSLQPPNQSFKKMKTQREQINVALFFWNLLSQTMNKNV